SQYKLAEEIQMTQRKISYLETGQLEPDLKTLWKISDYFEVSCDFLIGKSEY
nr:helix-turn-helix domain-containing protein [Clostridia bacterium]